MRPPPLDRDSPCSVEIDDTFDDGIPLSSGLTLHSRLFREPSTILPVVTPMTPRVAAAAAVDFATPVRAATDALVSERVYSTAALYVDAALHGRKFEGFSDNEFVLGGATSDRRSALRLRAYRWLHASWWRAIYISAACLHVALAAIEYPSVVPQWGTTGSMAAYALEWLCVALYALDFSLTFIASPSARAFFRQSWRRARLTVFALILVDMVVVLSSGLDFRIFRFSRCTRPFMIIFRLRNLRKVLAAFFSTLRRAVVVYVLIAFLILGFGFVGFALLNNTVHGVCTARGGGRNTHTHTPLVPSSAVCSQTVTSAPSPAPCTTSCCCKRPSVRSVMSWSLTTHARTGPRCFTFSLASSSTCSS